MDSLSYSSSDKMMLVNFNGNIMKMTKDEYVDFMQTLSEWYN